MLQDMLSTTGFWDRCRVNEADHHRLFRLVDALCRISARCNEKGLLAANQANAVDELPDPLCRAAFRMVDEGWPAEFIEETCCSSFATSGATGADLVAMVLAVKAAVMVTRGVETKLVRVALTAIAGGARALDEQSGEWRLLRT
jgi:hypothetical protein